MKALILAAGRGCRLRPLTDTTPKPLLPVCSSRLCDWQLAACQRAGITEIVMNTAYLASAFESLPAEYAAKGLRIALSREGTTQGEALETLGGIVKALPLLTDGTEPFLVLAGDIAHDFDLHLLTQKREDLITGNIDAALVAVPNPSYLSSGDLNLAPDGQVFPGAGPFTYACLAALSPRIFKGLKPVRAKLFPWLWQFRVTAQIHRGFWSNVGDATEYNALCSNRKALFLAQFSQQG